MESHSIETGGKYVEIWLGKILFFVGAENANGSIALFTDL